MSLRAVCFCHLKLHSLYFSWESLLLLILLLCTNIHKSVAFLSKPERPVCQAKKLSCNAHLINLYAEMARAFIAGLKVTHKKIIFMHVQNTGIHCSIMRKVISCKTLLCLPRTREFTNAKQRLSYFLIVAAVKVY